MWVSCWTPSGRALGIIPTVGSILLSRQCKVIMVWHELENMVSGLIAFQNSHLSFISGFCGIIFSCEIRAFKKILYCFIQLFQFFPSGISFRSLVWQGCKSCLSEGTVTLQLLLVPFGICWLGVDNSLDFSKEPKKIVVFKVLIFKYCQLISFLKMSEVQTNGEWEKAGRKE